MEAQLESQYLDLVLAELALVFWALPLEVQVLEALVLALEELVWIPQILVPHPSSPSSHPSCHQDLFYPLSSPPSFPLEVVVEVEELVLAHLSSPPSSLLSSPQASSRHLPCSCV